MEQTFMTLTTWEAEKKLRQLNTGTDHKQVRFDRFV